MNLFDVILARKIEAKHGGGGGGGTLKSRSIDANGDYIAEDEGADGYSSVLVQIKIHQYEVTANSFATLTIPIMPNVFADGVTTQGEMTVTLGDDTAIFPITIATLAGGVHAIYGGTVAVNSALGGVISATYTPDTQGVNVTQFGMIQNGTYQDITSMAGYATNIKFRCYYLPSV